MSAPESVPSYIFTLPQAFTPACYTDISPAWSPVSTISRPEPGITLTKPGTGTSCPSGVYCIKLFLFILSMAAYALFSAIAFVYDTVVNQGYCAMPVSLGLSSYSVESGVNSGGAI